jgi:hypothetical protein
VESTSPAPSGLPKPKLSPRVLGFRLLLVGLALSAAVFVAISRPALRFYGALLSPIAIRILAGALSGILSVAVPFFLIGLVSVITGKSLEGASDDWDRLEGFERGILGCGLVLVVVFLIYKVGSFWASLP